MFAGQTRAFVLNAIALVTYHLSPLQLTWMIPWNYAYQIFEMEFSTAISSVRSTPCSLGKGVYHDQELTQTDCYCRSRACGLSNRMLPRKCFHVAPRESIASVSQRPTHMRVRERCVGECSAPENRSFTLGCGWGLLSITNSHENPNENIRAGLMNDRHFVFLL